MGVKVIYQIEVPDYDENGIKTEWEYDFEITCSVFENAVNITANRAGLLSLAFHLLTLAQEDVPSGSHIHYDESNSLEDGSNEFVFIKK